MDTETHELIAGYALGALDDADQARAEALLATSADAREELRSFAEVTAALAVGAIGPAPSAGLRGRILEGARAEPQVVVPLAPPVRRGRAAPVLAAASAIAAVVAIGLGLWGVSLSGKLGDTRAALDRERSVGSVLSDPNARTVSLTSAAGRLVVDGDSRAVLVFDRIDTAPAGKTYQVWVVNNDVATSAGLFPGGGRQVVPVGPVSAGDLVAVTIEDEAGAEQPTSKPIVSSSEV
jgi:anti-sigma-K factor RskA